MLLINAITNDPRQQMVLNGIPGVNVALTLRFMPRTQIWNMDVSYNSFLAQGIPLLCSPNLLRQWLNILPFGLACTNIYRLDPYTLNDFAIGNSSLYLLNSDDVAAVESEFYS